MTSFGNQAKSVELAKDKLLGFRHLPSSGDTATAVSQANELFTKRGGETPVSKTKLVKDKLLGFRHLASLDDKGKLAAQAEDLFNKRGSETGTEPSRK